MFDFFQQCPNGLKQNGIGAFSVKLIDLSTCTRFPIVWFREELIKFWFTTTFQVKFFSNYKSDFFNPEFNENVTLQGVMWGNILSFSSLRYASDNPINAEDEISDVPSRHSNSSFSPIIVLVFFPEGPSKTPVKTTLRKKAYSPVLASECRHYEFSKSCLCFLFNLGFKLFFLRIYEPNFFTEKLTRKNLLVEKWCSQKLSRSLS